VTKRKVTALVVLACLAGGVIGGFIGFAWHAPGRPTTWSDIRDWATAVAIVLGLPALLYQLNLQRLQFADEAKRNVGRDDLLDRQRRELQQSERLRNREQAEDVNLTWKYDGQASAADVNNGSRRPIRDVACQLKQGHAGPLLRPEKVSELTRFSGGGPVSEMLVPAEDGVTDGWRVANIRSGETFVFKFGVSRRGADSAYLMLVRFTDDAGFHWELDHHLHLMQLDDRDW
jgi:hypothetical protein